MTERPQRPRVVKWLRRFAGAVGLWVVCLPLLIAFAATPWAKRWLVPTVDRLLVRETAMQLPASFREQRRSISGGLDPNGFFAATVAAADVESLCSALRLHATRSPPKTDRLVAGARTPRWWRSPTWPDERVLEIHGDGGAFRVHVSPSTGNVEIEWADV